MGVVDVAVLASMSVLVVFFGGVAVLEWWSARRTDQRSDAHVIPHARSNREVSSAA